MATADPSHQLDEDALRAKVLKSLRLQGFDVSDDGTIIAPDPANKAALRQLHAEATQAQRVAAPTPLKRREGYLVSRLAAGDEVDPQRVDPMLVPVVGYRGRDADLWRWCTLHWSIPVGKGYGRRLRFLVIDEGHDGKVMGVIGLHDPVFALAPRDEWIGWSQGERMERLTWVLDAYALGAVPPYSSLLGGKLVALLASSTEVRQAFRTRYGHRRTMIADRDPDAHLALVTTTSALGRSSVYNRLRGPDGAPGMESVGYTTGTGDFHLAGPVFAELNALAAEHGAVSGRHERWGGNGWRNRREVFQRAFKLLGLDFKALRAHGIRREVFVAPLASNARQLLRAQEDVPRWQTLSVSELGAHWRARWAVPRSHSDPSYKAFDPETWRLWTEPGSSE